jgi:hypothetical protein
MQAVATARVSSPGELVIPARVPKPLALASGTFVTQRRKGAKKSTGTRTQSPPTPA